MLIYVSSISRLIVNDIFVPPRDLDSVTIHSFNPRSAQGSYSYFHSSRLFSQVLIILEIIFPDEILAQDEGQDTVLQQATNPGHGN